MAPVHLQGKAIAIAMAGIPVALSLGVPAGTFLGQALDWRVTFLIMTALAIALLPWITTTVPDHPGQRQEAQLDAAELGVRQPVQGTLPDDVHGQRTQHPHHGVHLRFGAVVLLATVMGLSWWGECAAVGRVIWPSSLVPASGVCAGP